MAGSDKTEKPTPQRLREARKKGDVPTSPEFTGAAMLVVAIIVFQQQAGHVFNGLLALLARDLAAVANAPRLTNASIGASLRSEIAAGLMLLLPLAITMMVAGLVVGAINTRGLLSLKGITPSLRKLNPLTNAKHIVSKEGLILLVKALFKVLAAVAVLSGWSHAWQAIVPNLGVMPVASAAGLLWGDALSMALQIAAVFLVIGAVDLGYRYFSWSRRLRMTKQEVKDEARQSEGDAQTRSRMRGQARRRLRALIAGSGLRRVPQADVIITNPTHFAIAIEYKQDKMRAPRVIAKGQNLTAKRIREAAQRHNIPIVENKPLAQALYKSVEVNAEIPAELYQAVAQVLAFVYRMRAPRRPAAGRRLAGAPRATRSRI